MSNSIVFNQYETLPDIYKNEVNDFIEFLYSKKNDSEINKNIHKRNAFGILKGKIEITDELNDTLDDFKEYV
jgi:hypothetical protein